MTLPVKSLPDISGCLGFLQNFFCWHAGRILPISSTLSVTPMGTEPRPSLEVNWGVSITVFTGSNGSRSGRWFPAAQRPDAFFYQPVEGPTVGKIVDSESTGGVGGLLEARPRPVCSLCWRRPNYHHQGQGVYLYY